MSPLYPPDAGHLLAARAPGQKQPRTPVLDTPRSEALDTREWSTLYSALVREIYL